MRLATQATETFLSVPRALTLLGSLLVENQLAVDGVGDSPFQSPQGFLVVLADKLLAMVTAILILVLVVFAVNGFWNWVIAATEGQPAGWPTMLELSRGVGAGWLVLGVWSLFGAVLGTLLRSTSLAVGLGLVWALAIENLVRGFAGLLGFLDVLQRGLPGTNAGSLVAALGAATLDQTGGTPGVTAVVSGPGRGRPDRLRSGACRDRRFRPAAPGRQVDDAGRS